MQNRDQDLPTLKELHRHQESIAPKIPRNALCKCGSGKKHKKCALQEKCEENKPKPFNHVEAFCLMKYQSRDGEIEMIWNSRDGVTPFMIALKGGKEAHHADWNQDRRLTNFVPPVGMRIFVDLTEDAARAHAAEMVEKYWDDKNIPMSSRYESKEAAITELAKNQLETGGGGQPDLIEVTEEIHQEFVKKYGDGADFSTLLVVKQEDILGDERKPSEPTREIPDELVQHVSGYMGEKGRKFFQDVVKAHGRASAVLPGEIPWSTHFNEGMQIRNCMRHSELCKDWSDHDFDNNWEAVVMRALQLMNENQTTGY